jgi:hypothetical protein
VSCLLEKYNEKRYYAFVQKGDIILLLLIKLEGARVEPYDKSNDKRKWQESCDKEMKEFDPNRAEAHFNGRV